LHLILHVTSMLNIIWKIYDSKNMNLRTANIADKQCTKYVCKNLCFGRSNFVTSTSMKLTFPQAPWAFRFTAITDGRKSTQVTLPAFLTNCSVKRLEKSIHKILLLTAF